MILEIDMGNTRLKWRILDHGLAVVRGAIGVESPLNLLVDKLEPHRSAIKAVMVSSVVGSVLEQKLADWSSEYLKSTPTFLRTGAVCGMVRNGYRDPKTLGVDRWLALVAAYRIAASACIVVSCGTAITVDLLAQDGRHLGGFIAPGLNLMLDSLTSRARQIKLTTELPVLSLSPAGGTSDAVYAACAAMVTGLIDNGVRQLHLLDENAAVQMIFTGGDAEKLLSFYPQARVVPDLVLDGIACVMDYPQGAE